LNVLNPTKVIPNRPKDAMRKNRFNDSPSSSSSPTGVGDGVVPGAVVGVGLVTVSGGVTGAGVVGAGEAPVFASGGTDGPVVGPVPELGVGLVTASGVVPPDGIVPP
jgi:hypothetical protein